jgi:hypothetical protein
MNSSPPIRATVSLALTAERKRRATRALVARFVPQPVIHRLETIEIEKIAAVQLAGPPRLGHGMPDPVEQEVAIRQAGQRVVQGADQMPLPLLFEFAFVQEEKPALSFGKITGGPTDEIGRNEEEIVRHQQMRRIFEKHAENQVVAEKEAHHQQGMDERAPMKL